MKKTQLFVIVVFWALTAAVLLLACGSHESGGNGRADDDLSPADDDASPADDDASPDDDDDDDDDNDDATPPPDPANPGPYDIAYADLTFHDPSSDKDQRIRAYYPTADHGASIETAHGRRPLIIYGPGFSLPMDLYFSYGEHLASYGFIVVMRNSYVVSHLGLARTTSAIIDWAQSQSQQVGSLFYRKVDLTHIGTSGHSMGGKVSLLTAYYDKRVTASATVDAVDMSPLPTPDFPSVTPELMPDIRIPTLLIGSSDGGMCAPADDNYHQYYLHANAPSIEITIEKSGHVTFCDLPDSIISLAGIVCPTGGGNFEQIRMLTNRYLTAFYEYYFENERGYAYYLVGGGMKNDVSAGLVKTEKK